MAYTWTNGELITAEKLNQTGGGGSDPLVVNVIQGEGNVWHLDKNYTEIRAAGTNVVFLMREEVSSYSVDEYYQFVAIGHHSGDRPGTTEYFVAIRPGYDNGGADEYTSESQTGQLIHQGLE